MSIQRKTNLAYSHDGTGGNGVEVLRGVSNCSKMLTFLWIFPVYSIQVKYAPKLAVAIVQGAADNGRIPEGNSIKLLCDSNANPNNVVYQWYMNDVQIVDATFNELVISRVTNPMHSLL